MSRCSCFHVPGSKYEQKTIECCTHQFFVPGCFVRILFLSVCAAHRIYWGREAIYHVTFSYSSHEPKNTLFHPIHSEEILLQFGIWKLHWFKVMIRMVLLCGSRNKENYYGTLVCLFTLMLPLFGFCSRTDCTKIRFDNCHTHMSICWHSLLRTQKFTCLHLLRESIFISAFRTKSSHFLEIFYKFFYSTAPFFYYFTISFFFFSKLEQLRFG